MDPEAQKQPEHTNEAEPVTNASATPEAEPQPAAAQPTNDNSQYCTFAILGYILPFLFFLPLLDDKTKHVPYVRFHANQQLIPLVIVLALYVLHSILFLVLMSLGYLVAQFFNLTILALAIYGAYNAYLGKMKELPFVGKFRILK